MPSRIDRVQVGARLGQRLAIDVSDELRRARIAAGLTQTQVATAIGVRRMAVSEVERAKSAPSVHLLARHAAAVGLRLSIKLYPVGGALRDAAQVRYTKLFVDRVGRPWQCAIEVPMPLAGDLRAIDVVLRGRCTIAVEIVTRLHDVQAVVRAAQLKKRDYGADRLIIVVAGTHANRASLEEARHVLASSFDLDTHRTMAKLAAGEDPGRDAIVVLS